MRPGLSALLLVMLALVSFAGAAERGQPVAVGEEAPDFTLSDHQRRPFRLSEAVRQRDFVVLAFYVKAFTGG